MPAVRRELPQLEQFPRRQLEAWFRTKNATAQAGLRKIREDKQLYFSHFYQK
jgi:hypothetical protein